ncbi:MAG: phosphatidylserine decarboxylase [Ruminococcus sp.]|nr:phosphatidylserine decarboxylase [Ruminococcus sp.]
MKYRDRQGNEYDKTTGQDKFLADVYGSAFGRSIMKFLGNPVFSKASRVLLNSKISAMAIDSFCKKNNIDLSDYEDRKFTSFNDFFTRKIKNGKRFFSKDKNLLCSPSDGKVSAYEITGSSEFAIKNSVYTVCSLLRDKKLADRYNGGTALIIRLSVDDYHRYCYPCDGVKSRNRTIKGILHTVNPIVSEYLPVYLENSREYCMIRSEKFGDIIQMEVGALLVGKITNDVISKCKVSKGEEKGFFEFGGSTIVLLLEKDKVSVCEEFFENTRQGFETVVKQGDVLGESLI